MNSVSKIVAWLYCGVDKLSSYRLTPLVNRLLVCLATHYANLNCSDKFYRTILGWLWNINMWLDNYGVYGVQPGITAAATIIKTAYNTSPLWPDTLQDEE